MLSEGGNMTNQYILSFDPGVSTGVSLVELPEDGPPRLVEGWQFTGGPVALLEWVSSHRELLDSVDHVCVEKFKPINHSNYALTMASVTPLVCEGVLLATGIIPTYPEWVGFRKPGDHYVVGGASLADKKKRLRAFLKDTENYRMPKELGTPDSDDFASAAGHAFAYAMKVLNHRPTFDLVRGYVVRLDDKENK